MSVATALRTSRQTSGSSSRVRGRLARASMTSRSVVAPGAAANVKSESHTVPCVSLTMRIRSFSTYSVTAKSIVVSRPLMTRVWRKRVPTPDVTSERSSMRVTPPIAWANRRGWATVAKTRVAGAWTTRVTERVARGPPVLDCAALAQGIDHGGVEAEPLAEDLVRVLAEPGRRQRRRANGVVGTERAGHEPAPPEPRMLGLE